MTGYDEYEWRWFYIQYGQVAEGSTASVEDTKLLREVSAALIEVDVGEV